MSLCNISCKCSRIPIKRRIVPSNSRNLCIASAVSAHAGHWLDVQYHLSRQQEKAKYYDKHQRRHKVFVSRHNQSLQISTSQITDFCTRHFGFSITQGSSSQHLRTTPTHVILRECPFCPKPTHDKPDNMFKLYIQIGGGAYFCHRCGAKGSWFDFTQKRGSFEINDCNTGNNGSPSRSDSFHPQTRNGLSHMHTNFTNSQTGHTTDATCLPMPPPILQKLYTSNLLDPLPSDTDNHTNDPRLFGDRISALDYLMKERGFTRKTLRVYGVGLTTHKFPSNDPSQRGQYVKADCITFPWIMKASDVREQEALRGAVYVWNGDDGKSTKRSDELLTSQSLVLEDKSESDLLLEGVQDTAVGIQKSSPMDPSEDLPSNLSHNPFVIRRIKLRSIRNKAWQRLDPPGGGWSLFGLHTVPLDAKEVVLTEGEYDAMAVYQATGRPSVSLPNGCRSLPDTVLPLLERFEKIYLWMDNDGPGREGAEQFSKKLGLNRCYLVQPSSKNGKPAPKDANEALLHNHDLEQIIQDARLMPHHRILTFAAVRDQVLEEILNPNKYSGIQVPSLPIFNSIIKGFRRGEMSVLTGPTGSGKTTFLGQLSLDFAEQGHPTLWGSFEIKNTRLLHKLMQQFSREPLVVDGSDSINYLNALADRFENLPLYFMKFHGGSDVDDVLDAMDYAAYVHDVQHIILDNLQFMISRNGSGSRSSYDKFDYQDMAIEKFRKFATERNVHVTVVVHPRKEDEYSKLGISSIFGSAKATQEADSVLILQYDGQRKYIEVKKNRFDGTLGYCELHFQRKSCRYSDQPEPGKTLTIPSRGLLKPAYKRPITGIEGAQSMKDRIESYHLQSLK